jgi:hypothetical protein
MYISQYNQQKKEQRATIENKISENVRHNLINYHLSIATFMIILLEKIVFT